MKVSQIKELIKDMADDENLVVVFYDRDEANEYILNAFEAGEEQPEITDGEWATVVEEMNDDEGLWQVAQESFAYSMNKIEEKRQKSNS